MLTILISEKSFKEILPVVDIKASQVAPSPVNKMAKAYAYLMGSIHHVKRKNCYNKFDKLNK